MAKFRAPFPRYIDKPKMFGVFEADEAISIVLSVGVMLLVGFGLAINVAVALLMGVTIGVFFALLIKGIKKNYADGYLYHLMYRKGLFHPYYNGKAAVMYSHLIKKGVKTMPNGFVTTLVE